MIIYSNRKRREKVDRIPKPDIYVTITRIRNILYARVVFRKESWKVLKADRINLGYDEDNNRLYFIPDEYGYTLSGSNSMSRKVTSSIPELVELLSVNRGYYDLGYNPHNELHYIDLANRRV